MKTPEDIWSKLTEKLDPSTHTVDNIKSVSVKTRTGGVVARTIRGPDQEIVSESDEDDSPSSLEEIEQSLEEAREEIEDIKTNEDVFIYEEFGLSLKSMIERKVEEVVESTPALTECDIRRVTVTEESIIPVVYMSTQVPTSETDLYDRLSEILYEEDEIDSPDEFSHGAIDSVYYTDSGFSEGWEFDGTLYRLTKEPYKYWSEGPDTDYPTNMEEWAEFASDSESSKEQTLNRDDHLIHFHPMARGLSEDHPYIDWFNDAEELAEDKFEVDKDEVRDLSLSTVDIDEKTVYLEVSLVIE